MLGAVSARDFEFRDATLDIVIKGEDLERKVYAIVPLECDNIFRLMTATLTFIGSMWRTYVPLGY